MESTPLGTNTTNGTTSPIGSIPVEKKTPKPMPLTPPKDLPAPPTDFPEQNGKAHIPGDPDTDPSLSDSSSNKSNSLKNSKFSKSIKKRSDKKKKRRKQRKQDASDS